MLCFRAKEIVISRDRAARLKEVTAACLALLISFSTFSSAVSQSLAASSANKSCCRTKTKCCCHKKQVAGEHQSAAFSARSCPTSCGQSRLGVILAQYSFLTQAKGYVSTNKPFSGVTYTRPAFIELASYGCKLWQRPPPVPSLA